VEEGRRRLPTPQAGVEASATEPTLRRVKKRKKSKTGNPVTLVPVEAVTRRIYLVRGHKVMLDTELTLPSCTESRLLILLSFD
jgi:hypothetical protein